MMLDHDSPLVQPSAAPEAPEALPEPLPRLGEAPPPPPLQRIDLVFEQTGSLGIEFKELAAPFIIEQVHSTGLAYGKDLQKGDQLILVGGVDVTKLAWDDLVKKLGPRPVLMTFERPTAVDEEPAAASFMSGLGSTMRSLGGSVMEQGFDLGKVGSAGLEIGTKGLELGSKVSSAGIGFGSKALAALTTSDDAGAEAESKDPTLLAEHEALSQQVGQLQKQLADAVSEAKWSAEQYQKLQSSCQEESRQKEEQRQLAASYQEKCASLTQQVAMLQEAQSEDSQAARLSADRDALAQQVQQLEKQLADASALASSAASQNMEDQQRLQESLQEEARQKEEQKQLAVALQEKCAALEKQVEALKTEAPPAVPNGDATRTSELAAEHEAHTQKVQQLETQLAEASSLARHTTEQYQEEARQKEEQRQLALSYQEQCASLTKQVDALSEAGHSAAHVQEEAARLSAERDALAQQVQLLEKQLADAAGAVSRSAEDQQQLASSLQEEATRVSSERDALAQQVQQLEKQLADASSAVSRDMDDQQRVQASLQQEATRLSTERDALAQQVQHLEKQLADASGAVSRNMEDQQKLTSSLQEEATRLSTERDALAQQVQHLEKQLADASSAVSRNMEDQQKLASSLQEEARQKEEQKHLVATLQEQCSSLAKELEAQIAARQSADNSHQGVPNGDAAQPQAEAEREALVQQVRHLEQQLAEAASRASQSTEQYQMLQSSYQEEARQKEEQRQIAISYQEHCNNLTKQVETLREACQNLTTDHQQKAGLEGQVAQLLRMNAQWQQAHQNLNAESEGLRQRLVEVERLQLEVRRLQPFEEASNELEAKLKEAELQLEQRSQVLTDLQRQRAADAAAIQRLQGDLESTQETGASEAGHLESELLERSKECATLRRERNEAHQKLQELMQKSQENSQVADAGRALSTENEKLQQELAMSKEELKSLNAVVERCLSKMEAESRERPFLVDKRMVTQMLAAYLEQRENPGPQQEILHKMADLLGFTSAEREQVGLSQKRKTPLQMQEPQGLADLTDRFVDFLMEESEAG